MLDCDAKSTDRSPAATLTVSAQKTKSKAANMGALAFSAWQIGVDVDHE